MVFNGMNSLIIVLAKYWEYRKISKSEIFEEVLNSLLRGWAAIRKIVNLDNISEVWKPQNLQTQYKYKNLKLNPILKPSNPSQIKKTIL